MASIVSTAIFMAMNSEPMVDVSTVACALENHAIGAELRYRRIPVWDLHVTQFPAWSASTKTFIWTALPRGSDAFGAMFSFTSR